MQEEGGLIPLCDVLRKNTTLTELKLDCEKDTKICVLYCLK